MCYFLDHSQTHFRGLRGIKIKKIKGKTDTKLYENTIFVENFLIKKKLFSVSQIFPNLFFNDQCTGGSKKQQIN